MARGWESKSVEAQQSEASESTTKPAERLSPELQARQRQAQGLELSRKRIIQQLQSVTHDRHREMLEKSLSELDRRLSELRQS
jgi:hypothetical protein